VRNIFGQDATNITAHTIKAGHTISVAASAFIAERIVSAVEGKSAVTPKPESLSPAPAERLRAVKKRIQSKRKPRRAG